LWSKVVLGNNVSALQRSKAYGKVPSIKRISFVCAATKKLLQAEQAPHWLAIAPPVVEA
jgi:hypothetical protein